MEPRTSINSTSLFLVFKNPLKFIREKKKKKAWKKISNLNQRERERERGEEELRELSRIICYSKHNDKMYIRTPFVEFYN